MIVSRGLAKNLKMIDINGIPYAVGIIVSSVCSVGIYFEIRHSMEKPKKFAKVMSYVFNFIVFYYSLFSMFCYVTFGEESNDVVLFNLPDNNKFYSLIKFLYCLTLCVGYPLALFPMAKIIENLIFSKEYLTYLDQESLNDIRFEVKIQLAEMHEI